MKSKLSSMFGAIVFTGLLFSPLAFGLRAAGHNLMAVNTQDAYVYKYKDAGIQFEVPDGWHASTYGSDVVLNKKTFDDNLIISVSFWLPDPPSPSLDDALKKYWFDPAKNDYGVTDVKKVGLVEKTTHNGMALIKQSFTGKETVRGGMVKGSVVALQATVPIVIISYSTEKASDEVTKDFEKLMSSIKKIQ